MVPRGARRGPLKPFDDLHDDPNRSKQLGSRLQKDSAAGHDEIVHGLGDWADVVLRLRVHRDRYLLRDGSGYRKRQEENEAMHMLLQRLLVDLTAPAAGGIESLLLVRPWRPE